MLLRRRRARRDKGPVPDKEGFNKAELPDEPVQPAEMGSDRGVYETGSGDPRRAEIEGQGKVEMGGEPPAELMGSLAPRHEAP